MSRYEWQKGSIKIPSGQWVSLRRELIEAANRITKGEYEQLLKLHAHLKAVSKGKRKFDYLAAVREWEMKHLENGQDGLPTHLVAQQVPGTTKIKVSMPRKSAMPFAKASTRQFEAGSEATIFLNDKTRTLHWEVQENNHAAERAWEHPMGRALNHALNRIKWVRGTGGEIRMNDEYNRDDGRDNTGSGGSYVAKSYGPKGQDSFSTIRRRSSRAVRFRAL